MTYEFNDRVAIITGGGSGIGKAIAAQLLEGGARLVLNGRREALLQETARSLDATGERIRVVAGDIARTETSTALVQSATDAFGGVDILVNAAGVFAPKPFADHVEADFHHYVDIILKGTFFASQAVLGSMTARGGGAILNIGSMWGSQAVGATPSAAYSAAKAGVHALTKNLALELAAASIRVNTIAPAVVETPVYGTFLPEDQVAETIASFAPFHPLGRVGKADDIANAAAFLVSEMSSWITGAVVPVDGGVMAGRS